MGVDSFVGGWMNVGGRTKEMHRYCETDVADRRTLRIHCLGGIKFRSFRRRRERRGMHRPHVLTVQLNPVTPTQPLNRSLPLQIHSVEHFVCSVNSHLTMRQENERLKGIMARIESYDVVVCIV